MRLVLRLALLLLVLLMAPGSRAWADPATHALPDTLRQLSAFLGDQGASFVVSGCTPAVPSASLTLAAFACEGAVRDSGTGALLYVSQGAAALTLTGSDGFFYLALTTDTTAALASWTRVVGTHYAWRPSATRPAAPASGVLVDRLTVAGGVITAVDWLMPTNPQRDRTLNFLDPFIGGVCDGVADDQPAFTRLARLLQAEGGVVRLPNGTCRTSSADPLFTLVDPGGPVRLEGQGITRTVLSNAGVGEALEIYCPVSCNGHYVGSMTLEGNNTGSRGLRASGWQDSVIEHVQFNGWLSDSLGILGTQSLHVMVRDARFTPGAAAVAGARAIRAVGNVQRFHNNYFNLGTNIARYDTALDLIGCGGCESRGNVFDGVATAIRSRLPFSSIGDYCEASTANPVRVPTFIVHDANNTLTLVHAVGAQLDSTLPCFVNFAATDRRYLAWVSATTDSTLNVHAGAVVLRTLAVPAFESSPIHDFQPGGASDAAFWILDTGGDTERTITGILGGYDGRVLTLYNTGGADLLFTHNDAASAAGNRFLITDGLTYRVHQRATLQLIYTSLNAAWRIVDNKPAFIGSVKATIDFGVPGTVPGCVESADVALTGAALGDSPVVSVSLAKPANFVPLGGYVRAAGLVRFVWCQLAGAGADPDGAGADYRMQLWRTP